MELKNHVRAYAFLARVFAGQQGDPFCSICKARVNSVTKARESIAGLEREYEAGLRELPDDYRQMLAEANRVLTGLVLPEHAAGQKKAGNCKLPEGVCFIKASLAILQKV